MIRNEELRHHVADAIGRRTAIGPDPSVSGWQSVLKQLLGNMAPYLVPGRLVTFQTLAEAEKTFFEQLAQGIAIPPRALALYLPPSVRYQMMYTNHGRDARYDSDHDPNRPPDAGVLLAAGRGNFDRIVNALFAYPPSLAAVDVYECGSLIGGYTYPTIAACRQGLGDLLKTYLGA